MPLTESNRNIMSTHFGGSLYAMVDPHLMILLMQRLGPGYVVWDREATIEFVRPGRGEVSATLRITEQDLEGIRAATESGERHFPRWTVDVAGTDGTVVARVQKTLFVRRVPEGEAP